MGNFNLPDANTPFEEKGVGEFVKDGTKMLLDVDVDEVKANWNDSPGATGSIGDDKKYHPGYINIISDVANSGVKALDDLGKAITRDTKIDNRSLFARARNSICQFPVYISQSIRVNEAHIISKQFERVYASLMQAVLANQPIIDEADVNNLKFLRKIHTNIREAAEVVVNQYYQPIDQTDEILKESVFFEQQITDNITVRFTKAPSLDPYLIAENARLMHEPLTGLPYLMMEADSNSGKKPDPNSRAGAAARLQMKDKGETMSTSEEIRHVTLTPNEVEAMAIDASGLSDREIQLAGANDERLREMTFDKNKVNSEDRRRYSQNQRQLTADVIAHAPDNITPEEENKLIMDAMRRKEELEKMIADATSERQEVRAKLSNSIDEFKKNIKDGKNTQISYNDGKYITSDRIKRNAIESDRKNDIAQDTLDFQKKKHKDDKKAAKARLKLDREKLDFDKTKESRTVHQGSGSARILKDVEIKKINGMDAYPIEVTFIVRSGSGKATYLREVKFIIGVKTILHLINPKDLSEDLREIVTGNIKRLQKVRYKTGEISYKDYVFNKSNIKKDAAKGVQYNKKWLNTLKRLGEFGKSNGALLQDPARIIAKGDVPIPNGTMILSQADVTTLTAETGIDLSSVSNAKRMAKALFLIAVAIVDSSAGTMKVLYVDSADNWDIQSLDSIASEIAKTDNSPIFKELNRMINR